MILHCILVTILGFIIVLLLTKKALSWDEELTKEQADSLYGSTEYLSDLEIQAQLNGDYSGENAFQIFYKALSIIDPNESIAACDALFKVAVNRKLLVYGYYVRAFSYFYEIKNYEKAIHDFLYLNNLLHDKELFYAENFSCSKTDNYYYLGLCYDKINKEKLALQSFQKSIDEIDFNKTDSEYVSFIECFFAYKLNNIPEKYLLELNKQKKIFKAKTKDEKVIFRAWITKNGKRIHAKDYGLKAFPIHIKNKRKPIYTPSANYKLRMKQNNVSSEIKQEYTDNKDIYTTEYTEDNFSYTKWLIIVSIILGIIAFFSR